jgi:S-formylglutathione hydrolase FrmB
VSVLQIRGPSVEGTHMRDAAHRAIAGLWVGGYGVMNIATQNRGVFGQAVSMTTLRQAFTFLTAGWRQAAADDAADSGFWNAVAGNPLRPPAVGGRPR